MVDVALAPLDVLAALLTVLLMGSRPAHPCLNINPGPVFQEQLNEVLVAPEAGNVQGKRTTTSIYVDVAGDAPADHLEVVDPSALLQQVVPLLIVDHQDVLAPGDLTQEAIKPLHGDSGVGSERVEDDPDVLPGLVGDAPVVAGGEEGLAILEEVGDSAAHRRGGNRRLPSFFSRPQLDDIEVITSGVGGILEQASLIKFYHFHSFEIQFQASLHTSYRFSDMIKSLNKKN